MPHHLSCDPLDRLDRRLDRLDRVMHTGTARVMWLWVLGEVWFTLLMAGPVVVLLWTR